MRQGWKEEGKAREAPVFESLDKKDSLRVTNMIKDRANSPGDLGLGINTEKPGTFTGEENSISVPMPSTSLQDDPPAPKTVKSSISKPSRCTEHQSNYTHPPPVDRHHCLSVKSRDSTNCSTTHSYNTHFAPEYL